MQMNIYMGGQQGQLDEVMFFTGWKVYTRYSDILDPGPANTFLLLDSRSDKINTGSFGISMWGFPNSGDTVFAQDFPGSYHLKAGGISFVDGHSEIRRWKDNRTMPPLEKTNTAPLTIWSPGNPDLVWLQERATRKP